MYGLSRNNLSDDEFRSIILTTNSGNLGGGTKESMISTISSGLTLPSSSIDVIDTSAMMFDVNISIDYITDINLLKLVDEVVLTNKAAGTYASNINVNSSRNSFLVNVSNINNGNTIM